MAQSKTAKISNIATKESAANVCANSRINLNAQIEPPVSYDTNTAIADDTTSRQFLALQNARNYFNEHLFVKVFGISLGPVMLRPVKYGTAYGYFRKESWKEHGQAAVPEISICPFRMHRSAEGMFSTLVHELCHQYQHEYGKPGRGGYHNAQFAKIMAQVGLICSSTGAPGGKQTGDQMTHYIDSDGLFKRVFDAMPHGYILPFKPLFDTNFYTYNTVELRTHTAKAKVPGNKNKTKFTCLNCSQAAWGKSSLNISCDTCKQKMVVINDFGPIR